MRIHRTLSSLAATLIACTLALTGTAGSAPSAPAGAAAGMTEISFGVYDGALASTIEVLAMQKGFMEKEGIKANPVKFTAGPTMMAAFIGGDTQFTTASPGFWTALEQGACFKTFGNGAQAYFTLIASQKAVAKTPALAKGYPESVRAMKGLRVGVVARGSTTEQSTSLILRSVGLDPTKDVTFIGTGSTQTVVTALENDQIDVQFSYPPIEQILKKNGTPYTVVANLWDGSVPIIKDAFLSMPAVNCAFAQKHPETTQKVCRAYTTAYKWATDPRNSKEMGAFMSKMLNLSPEMGQEVWDTYGKSTFSAGPAVRKDLWDAQLKFYPAVKSTPAFQQSTVSCEKGPN